MGACRHQLNRAPRWSRDAKALAYGRTELPKLDGLAQQHVALNDPDLVHDAKVELAVEFSTINHFFENRRGAA